MVCIILSSRSLRHSSVTLSLLFIPSSVFFYSSIESFISEWVCFVFSSSLLKFSLCTFILFPNSVSIIFSSALNSLSGNLFISVSLFFFMVFLSLFRLRADPLPFHFI